MGFLIIIVLAVIGAFWFDQSAKQEQEFMDACTKDHKQYECTALWRGGT